jgi:hypothetical protein
MRGHVFDPVTDIVHASVEHGTRERETGLKNALKKLSAMQRKE